jgi:hypothetical protein
LLRNSHPILAADDGRPLVLAVAAEVTPVFVGGEDGRWPLWVRQLGDGPQIGYLADGTLVAYDL